MQRATPDTPTLPTLTPPTRPRPPLSARSHSSSNRTKRSSFFPPCSPGASPETFIGAGMVRRASFHTQEELVIQVLNNLVGYGKFSNPSVVVTPDVAGIIFARALIFAFLPEKDCKLDLLEGTCYEVHSAVTKLVFRSTLADFNIAELVPQVIAFMRGSGFAEESGAEWIAYDSACVLIRGAEDICPVISISNACIMSTRFIDKLKMGLDHMRESRPELYEELQLQQGARVVTTTRVAEGVRGEIAKIRDKFPGERVLSLSSSEDSADFTATLDFALAAILIRHLNIFLKKLQHHRFDLVGTPDLTVYFNRALCADVDNLIATCEHDRAGEGSASFFWSIAVSLTRINDLLMQQINFEQTVEDIKIRGELPSRRSRTFSG